MYPYEENAFFLLILTVFLVRVHFFTLFFYLSDFKRVKKSVPLRGILTVFLVHFFLLILTVFLVRVHFFYSFFLFIRFQKSKKSVPLRGKCTFFLLILTVFLVRAHFFYSFFLFIRFQKSKKSVPLRGKCTFFTNFDCFPRKGTLFLLFFSIYQISKE